MAKEILDNNHHFKRFKKPKTLLVPKEPWLILCDEYQRKAFVGALMIFLVGLLLSLLLPGKGILLVLAVFVFSAFLTFSTRKRFSKLRDLVDHSFVLSASEIKEKFDGKEKRLFLEDIKYIEFHNWGIEIDTKKNPKVIDKMEEDGKIMIPCLVNDFDEVLSLFEKLKEKKGGK